MESKLKVAFWGLGSIAARHIKNLDTVLKQRGCQVRIDVFRHKEGNALQVKCGLPINNVYVQPEIENKQYDIIFITCPTSMHYDAIKICALHAKHLFIEKPLCSDVDIDIEALSLQKDAVYYVACPLRHTSVLQYVKENIEVSKVFSVRAISSSYLPDWRLGQDYRDTYSAHKALGGGVNIDLIHEWDYLTALLGLPKKVMYVGGKFSKLEIDSDDIGAYIGIYDDKIVELHLDYFGRKTIRECLLYLADETIRVDITNGRIEYLKSGECVDLQEDRDVYQRRELEHFLDIIDGKCENDSTIWHAIDVLKIAKGDWRQA